MNIIARTVAALAAIFITSTAHAGEFDGTWTGKWGGKASGKIQIVDNKVKAYAYKFRPQEVGTTKRSGNSLVFGTNYKITMTLTGKNTAHASYRRNSDTAEVDLVRE